MVMLYNIVEGTSRFLPPIFKIYFQDLKKALSELLFDPSDIFLVHVIKNTAKAVPHSPRFKPWVVLALILMEWF